MFLTSRSTRKRITIQGEGVGDNDELTDDEGILALSVCVLQAMRDVQEQGCACMVAYL